MHGIKKCVPKVPNAHEIVRSPFCVHNYNPVWQDWAIFEKFVTTNLLTKVAPKDWCLFGLFWKRSLNVKTAVASIWATFGHIWARFFAPISGHTVTLQRIRTHSLLVGGRSPNNNSVTSNTFFIKSIFFFLGWYVGSRSMRFEKIHLRNRRRG